MYIDVGDKYKMLVTVMVILVTTFLQLERRVPKYKIFHQHRNSFIDIH